MLNRFCFLIATLFLSTISLPSYSLPTAGCSLEDIPAHTPILDNFQELRQAGLSPLEVENVTFELNLPNNFQAKKAYKLLFAFHGGGGSWRANKIMTVFPGLALALERDYIVVSPISSARPTWNFERDFPRMQKLLAHLKREYCFDNSQIFATGHSAGSFLVYDIVLRRPEFFRAAGVASGGGNLDDIQDDLERQQASGKALRVPPLLAIHSPFDEQITPNRFYDTYMEYCKIAGCEFADGEAFGEPLRANTEMDENGFFLERGNGRVSNVFVERLIEPIIPEVMVADVTTKPIVNGRTVSPDLITCENVAAQTVPTAFCLYSTSRNPIDGVEDPKSHRPVEGAYQTAVHFFDGFLPTTAPFASIEANRRMGSGGMSEYMAGDGKPYSTPDIDTLLSLSTGTVANGVDLWEGNDMAQTPEPKPTEPTPMEPEPMEPTPQEEPESEPMEMEEVVVEPPLDTEPTMPEPDPQPEPEVVEETPPVEVSNSDLVLAFHFDDGSATDLSGANNHGVAVNTEGYSDSETEGALVFNGDDSRVELPGFELSGDAFTIAVRVNYFSLSRYGDNRIFSKADGTREDDHILMLSGYLRSGITRLRMRLKTDNSSDTLTLVASDGEINLNEWTHVAAVYDGQHMILYQDGVEVGRRAKTGAVFMDSRINTEIGRNPDGQRPFDGLMDDVMVYQRALSAEEVAALAR